MGGPTVKAAAGRYLHGRVARGEITKHTARRHRQLLADWCDHIGERQLRQLSRRDVERWREAHPRWSVGTWRLALAVLRGFARWCTDQGYVRRPWTDGVRPPRAPRRLPRALTGDQVRRLLAACPDERARLIVLLAVQCGLRAGEIARLEHGDIDWGTRTARITGKGGHERLVYLVDEVAEALEQYRRAWPASAGPVIRSQKYPGSGVVPATITTYVTRWARAAGVKAAPWDGVSCHAGRHTCATDMMRLGVHLRDIQRVLGHRSLATTQVYLGAEVAPLADAMEGRRYC